MLVLHNAETSRRRTLRLFSLSSLTRKLAARPEPTMTTRVDSEWMVMVGCVQLVVLGATWGTNVLGGTDEEPRTEEGRSGGPADQTY